MLVMKYASVISRSIAFAAYSVWIMCGLLAISASAQTDSLYTAKALVKTQSDAERQRAASQTLGEIVVRASGRSDAAEHPVIKNAQASAENYLFGFSYSDFTKTMLDGENEVPAMEITLGYSSDAINKLLKEAGLPVWPKPRPTLLVWVVSQTAQGLSVELDPQLLESLQQTARARGVPLIVAAQDIEDQLSIRPEDLWRVDSRLIDMASTRYRADAVVLLRLQPASMGEIPPPATAEELSELSSSSEAVLSSSSSTSSSSEFESSDSDASSSEAVVQEPWVAQWQLFHSVIGLTDGDTADTFSPLADKAVNQISDALAKHFSMAPNEDGPKSFYLKIDGVRDFRGFKQVQDYLSSLAVIKSMNIIKNDASTLVVKVTTDGDVKLLLNTLSLGDRLQLMSDVNQLLNGVVTENLPSQDATMSEDELARALEAEFEQSLMTSPVEDTPLPQAVSPMGTDENPIVYMWLR